MKATTRTATSYFAHLNLLELNFLLAKGRGYLGDHKLGLIICQKHVIQAENNLTTFNHNTAKSKPKSSNQHKFKAHSAKMPKWPFGSQKVKVECATNQRTTFACPTHHPQQQQQAKRCPPPPTSHNSTTNAAQTQRQAESKPGQERPPCWPVCTLYTLARSACNSGKQNFYYHRIFGQCWPLTKRSKCKCPRQAS